MQSTQAPIHARVYPCMHLHVHTRTLIGTSTSRTRRSLTSMMAGASKVLLLPSHRCRAIAAEPLLLLLPSHCCCCCRRVHMHAGTCTYVHVCECTHAHMPHVCTHACTHTCAHVQMNAYDSLLTQMNIVSRLRHYSLSHMAHPQATRPCVPYAC